MYEEMYIRLFEHRKINISKNELSEQLLKNLSNFFNPLMSQIDPYKLGDKQRKLDIGSQYATRILSQFGAAHDPATARVLVNYLIHECPDHGYVIDLDILSQFVTNVSSSSELGAEYESALRELSFYLFEADEVDHIGFILPDANMKIAEQPSSELVKIENATAKKTAKKQKNGAVIEPNNSIPVEEIIEN